MGTPGAGAAKPPKVVIGYLDGRRLQGYVFDFSPVKDTCRVFPSQTAQAGQGESVDLKTLKAIFFLHESLATELGIAAPLKPTAAPRRRIEVIFHDRERLEGTTEGYSKDRLGFFMVPEDPTGKILRVFVINRNVKEVKWIPAAAPAPKIAPLAPVPTPAAVASTPANPLPAGPTPAPTPSATPATPKTAPTAPTPTPTPKV